MNEIKIAQFDTNLGYGWFEKPFEIDGFYEVELKKEFPFCCNYSAFSPTRSYNSSLRQVIPRIAGRRPHFSKRNIYLRFSFSLPDNY